MDALVSMLSGQHQCCSPAACMASSDTHVNVLQAALKRRDDATVAQVTGSLWLILNDAAQEDVDVESARHRVCKVRPVLGH